MWEAQQAEDKAMIDEMEERAEPACWSWPVPDDEDLESYNGRVVQELSEVGKLTEDDIARILKFRAGGYDRELRLLYLFHDGRCAFCGTRNDIMVTDHDHATGLIRGYLCRGCNGHEGRSDTPMLRKYRERSPAAILGIEKIYVNIYGETPMTDRNWESAPLEGNAVTRLRF